MDITQEDIFVNKEHYAIALHKPISQSVYRFEAEATLQHTSNGTSTENIHSQFNLSTANVTKQTIVDGVSSSFNSSTFSEVLGLPHNPHIIPSSSNITNYRLISMSIGGDFDEGVEGDDRETFTNLKIGGEVVLNNFSASYLPGISTFYVVHPSQSSEILGPLPLLLGQNSSLNSISVQPSQSLGIVTDTLSPTSSDSSYSFIVGTSTQSLGTPPTSYSFTSSLSDYNIPIITVSASLEMPVNIQSNKPLKVKCTFESPVVNTLVSASEIHSSLSSYDDIYHENTQSFNNGKTSVYSIKYISPSEFIDSPKRRFISLEPIKNTSRESNMHTALDGDLIAALDLIKFEWVPNSDVNGNETYTRANLIWNSSSFAELNTKLVTGSKYGNISPQFLDWNKILDHSVSGSIPLNQGQYIKVRVYPSNVKSKYDTNFQYTSASFEIVTDVLSPTSSDSPYSFVVGTPTQSLDDEYLFTSSLEHVFPKGKGEFWGRVSDAISDDGYTASLTSIDGEDFSVNGWLPLSKMGVQLKGDNIYFNGTNDYRVTQILPQNFLRSPQHSIEATKTYGGLNYTTNRFIDLPPFASTTDWSNPSTSNKTFVRKALNPKFLTQTITTTTTNIDSEGVETISQNIDVLGQNTLSQGVIGSAGLLTGQPSLALTTVELQSDDSPSLGGTLDLNGQTIDGVGNINLQGHLASSTLFSPQGNFTELTATDISISDSITFKGFTFEDSQILSHTGSNIFGSSSLHTHQFTGSVLISGSKLKITGSVEAQNITGSLLGTSSFSQTSSISYGISGSPDILLSNVTSSNISASGVLIASSSLPPSDSEAIVSVVYDTGSGQFYYTGSYGGGGAGTGFPFSGSADLTGSLTISSSSPFIQIDSSSTSWSSGKLHNRGGALYWGEVKVASGSPIGANISNIVEDGSPQLGGDLDMQSNNILGNSNSNIILSGNNNKFFSASGDKIEIFGDITQSGNSNSTLLQSTKINQSLEVVNFITASIISASGPITASNLSGNNTGDQDLLSFISSSETGSFVVNSQTSSFVVNPQTGSFVVNSQTGSFVVNSQTSSFVVNSQTSSFVINSQTSSFVINAQTGSFVVNSQTGSFVVNSQTSSFVVNSETSSLVKNSETSSFVINSQTSSFVINSQTSSFVINSQTSSFVLSTISASFIDTSKILASNSISIGTPYSSSTLNVSGNIFISNVNDTNTPDDEGILIESNGEDGETINKIFFQKASPTGTYNGIEFLHNGSTNPLNGIGAGTFSITQHNNNVNGNSKFSIKSDGKIGIGTSSPTHDLHINPQTKFDDNITIASGKSITLGSGILINSSHISSNTYIGKENSNISIGRSDSHENVHIPNNLVVSQSATVIGDIIAGGTIKGHQGHLLTIGDPHRPIKALHIDRATIVFYSGSTSDSSSVEQARMSVNESTKEIEFKSGSEFQKVRASEINLGSNTSYNGMGSVQIGQSSQGFIAVNAEPGKYSTIFRAESTALSGDFRMGSITQKGSGSFAILLDADQIRPDAKFGVYSNTAIPGLTTPLITVSESGETRTYGHLKADDYVTTTNITASGNISASGIITSDIINVGNNQNIGSLNVGPSSNKLEIRGGNPLSGTNPQIISTTGFIDIEDNITVQGGITTLGNISGSYITTASFGSLQLNNLPTTPSGLPTGSVWVSGSKNDNTTNNVNCGTLMIVI